MPLWLMNKKNKLKLRKNNLRLPILSKIKTNLSYKLNKKYIFNPIDFLKLEIKSYF